MDDTEILREVLRFCSAALETAERFLDGAAVMILTEIIDIIEGGVSDSHPRTVSDS